MFDPLELAEAANDVGISNHVETKTVEENARRSLWVARGLLLLVAAIWGTNFAVCRGRVIKASNLFVRVTGSPFCRYFSSPQSVKYLENLCFHPPCNHPPSEAALARFGLAAAVSLPLLFKQRWDVTRAGLECGLWITLGYAAQALALATIDSGKCAFICSLTVVFVPVVSAIVYGKPIKPTNILAAAVALAGVGVLEGMFDLHALFEISPAAAADTAALASGAIETTSAVLFSSTVHTAAAEASGAIDSTGAVLSSTVHTAVTEASGPLSLIANALGVSQGDILALGQPIGFGTAFTRIEHYQEEFKDVPNRVLTIAAAQCVAVGAISLLWVLYDFNGSIPNFGYMLEPHRLAAIGWTGIVTTVIAIFIEGIALQTASATDASLAFATEPVWASLFGFVLLHETLGENSYVGGALILMACLIGALSDLLASSRASNTLNR